MRLILHAGQRLKQNHKDVFLPAHPLEPYLLGKEFGPMLSQENIQSPIIQCRRNLSIFEWILEIKRLSSEQSSLVWRQVEEMHCKRRRKEEDFSVVLILQEKFFTCELFKVIQDVTLLIHHYRTTLSFRNDFFKYNYRVGCAINLHSIMNSGLIPAGQKFEHKTGQYSSCLWILWTENTKILRNRPESTASCTIHAASVEEKSEHGVFGRHQSCSKELIEVLSDAIEHHHPLQCISKPIVSRRLFRWKLEKCTKKYLNHIDRFRRCLWEMIGWRNWVQKLFDKQKAPNQPNQIPIQVIEQGDLLWQNKRPVRVLRKSKHVPLLTARIPNCLLNV